ncbi:MAG: FliM/FliN family flagellar motor C-terminal domain-containing protein [Planctomycetota bacterium]
MARDVQTLLGLEVPIVVRLASRSISLREVLGLTAGAIIELPKNADEELDVFVNNVQIGFGSAVKVGENFGIQLTYVGDLEQRVTAIADEDANNESSDDEFAEQLLGGQL